MKPCYFSSLFWVLFSLFAVGCLHARARRVQSFPPGDYSKIRSTVLIPSTHSGWTILLTSVRRDTAAPPTGSFRRGADDLDLSRTQVTVRVSNLSDVVVVVTGWQGGAVKLAPNQQETIWTGDYPRESPEYPLFWTSSLRETKVGVELLFTPPLSTANALVLKMAENPL